MTRDDWRNLLAGYERNALGRKLERLLQFVEPRNWRIDPEMRFRAYGNLGVWVEYYGDAYQFAVRPLRGVVRPSLPKPPRTFPTEEEAIVASFVFVEDLDIQNSFRRAGWKLR